VLTHILFLDINIIGVRITKIGAKFNISMLTMYLRMGSCAKKGAII